MVFDKVAVKQLPLRCERNKSNKIWNKAGNRVECVRYLHEMCQGVPFSTDKVWNKPQERRIELPVVCQWVCFKVPKIEHKSSQEFPMRYQTRLFGNKFTENVDCYRIPEDYPLPLNGESSQDYRHIPTQ
ncbi:hypothetical protein HOLleu_36184 [Holothuria leucospilota]|uniref:Uncharacterized protein n=1 Tax=Holothuria leucospilota TaxID=206669 RepID=A0A9Q0YJE7_HOLLE|nr:hypothetical protein HOLleu_36184 [Holothuria leucospilota]